MSILDGNLKPERKRINGNILEQEEEKQGVPENLKEHGIPMEDILPGEDYGQEVASISAAESEMYEHTEGLGAIKASLLNAAKSSAMTYYGAQEWAPSFILGKYLNPDAYKEYEKKKAQLMEAYTPKPEDQAELDRLGIAGEVMTQLIGLGIDLPSYMAGGGIGYAATSAAYKQGLKLLISRYGKEAVQNAILRGGNYLEKKIGPSGAKALAQYLRSIPGTSLAFGTISGARVKGEGAGYEEAVEAGAKTAALTPVMMAGAPMAKALGGKAISQRLAQGATFAAAEEIGSGFKGDTANDITSFILGAILHPSGSKEAAKIDIQQRMEAVAKQFAQEQAKEIPATDIGGQKPEKGIKTERRTPVGEWYRRMVDDLRKHGFPEELIDEYIHIDPITMIPNYWALLKDLAANANVKLAGFDLRGFKAVQDARATRGGHLFGDAYIREVFKKMQEIATEEGGQAYRKYITGDEGYFSAPNDEILERIIQRLKAENEVKVTWTYEDVHGNKITETETIPFDFRYGKGDTLNAAEAQLGEITKADKEGRTTAPQGRTAGGVVEEAAARGQGGGPPGAEGETAKGAITEPTPTPPDAPGAPLPPAPPLDEAPKPAKQGFPGLRVTYKKSAEQESAQAPPDQTPKTTKVSQRKPYTRKPGTILSISQAISSQYRLDPKYLILEERDVRTGERKRTELGELFYIKWRDKKTGKTRFGLNPQYVQEGGLSPDELADALEASGYLNRDAIEKRGENYLNVMYEMIKEDMESWKTNKRGKYYSEADNDMTPEEERDMAEESDKEIPFVYRSQERGPRGGAPSGYATTGNYKGAKGIQTQIEEGDIPSWAIRHIKPSPGAALKGNTVVIEKHKGREPFIVSGDRELLKRENVPVKIVYYDGAEAEGPAYITEPKDVDHIQEKEASGPKGEYGKAEYNAQRHATYQGQKIPAFDIPEIVDLFYQVYQQYPVVRKKINSRARSVLGRFVQGPRKTRIDILASIAKDPSLLRAVIAHEIGHAMDYLPQRTLKLGNILGHVFSIYKYIKYTLLRKGKTFEMEPIREELKALTLWWNPVGAIEAQNKEYMRYRFRASELYADAFSVLLCDPVALQQRAPLFFEAFFDALSERPSLRESYDQIMQRILEGRTVEYTEEMLHGMFDAGEESYKRRLDKQKTSLWNNLVDELWNVGNSIRQAFGAESRAYTSWEDMVYGGSDAEAHLSLMHEAVLEPLRKSGATERDAGVMLFANHVIENRASLANPGGVTAERAKALLVRLRERLGDESYEQLAEAMDKFYAVRQATIIPIAEQSGMFSQALLQAMKDRYRYATMELVKFLEKDYGNSQVGKIYKQYGTFNAIANPLTATIMKDISIMHAVNRNNAKMELIKALLRHFPDKIKPSEQKWDGLRMAVVPTREPQMETLLYSQGGVVHGYDVPKRLAQAFDTNPYEFQGLAKLLRSMNLPFRNIYINWRIGFHLFNAGRDVLSALRVLPGKTRFGMPGPSLWEFISKYWTEGYKRAHASIWKGYDPIVNLMLNKKMLITSLDYLGLDPEDTQLEHLEKRFGIIKPKLHGIAKAKEAPEVVLKFGQTIERATKVAAFLYMTELKTNQPEVYKAWLKRARTNDSNISEEALFAHLVRNAGSPPFLIKGKAAPIYNNLIMFSNAFMRGWDVFSEYAARDGWEFWYKVGKYGIFPKMLMWAAKIGLVGVALKKMMDRISEYDLTNFYCIPLGETENGKTVYLRLPMDESSRTFGGLVWKALNGLKGPRDIAGALDFAQSQLPSTMPALALAMDAITFACGKNPYDHFRNGPAIPEAIFDAHDSRSVAAFVKYMSNKAGLGMIYKFSDSDVKGASSELERIMRLPGLADTLGRFIKVSDKGIAEQLDKPIQRIRTDEARRRLDLREAIDRLITGKHMRLRDITILIENNDRALDKRIGNMMISRYGDAFFRTLMKARTVEEQTAVIDEYIRLMNLPKNKKDKYEH